jgi:hypothetical protein
MVHNKKIGREKNLQKIFCFLAASTECSAGSNDHFVVGISIAQSRNLATQQSRNLARNRTITQPCTTTITQPSTQQLRNLATQQ